MSIDKTEEIVRTVKNWLMIESIKREIEEDEINEYIEKNLFELCPNLSIQEMKKIRDRVFLRLKYPLGILEPLVSDSKINEVMVNGVDHIFVEKDGRVERIDDAFSSEDELRDIIRYIAGRVHREFNELNPIVDARLSDGSRVCGVYNNVAVGGPALSIRKFKKEKIDMDTMIAYRSITSECAKELQSLRPNF